MVRINIINPRKLADQHLVAEYLEIMMLLGYAKKYPSNDGIPEKYCLGKGHIKFFKNKLIYLQGRHEEIKKEMNRRNFVTNKRIDLKSFDSKLLNDWTPKKEDFGIIKKRLIWKIKNKPNYYRYEGKKRDLLFFESLLKK